MRAKRSKKYRKIMDSYALAFSFHEPYQVLVDAAFLRTCHAFHMPLRQFLENTLHGQSRFMVTQCTLAKIMRDHAKSGVKTPRPDFLPPPTELPLRYCKHEDKGEGWGEVDCLLDLLSGMPKGNEMKKNKWHYILATADLSDQERRARGHVEVRERARAISGVPIVYVKRSVMVLEELSGASLAFRKGLEKDKFREGLVSGRKRGRDDGDSDSDEEAMQDPLMVEKGATVPRRGMQRAKGPNPLSVRRKKPKSSEPAAPPKQQRQQQQDDEELEQSKGPVPKRKRTRKHGGKGVEAETGDGLTGAPENIIHAHSRLQEIVA